MKRVSLTSTGAEAEIGGDSPSISADGRYVAFVSDDQLVPQDTDYFPDVYVRDQVLGTTTRVSVSSAGVGGNNYSESPRISANGRFVTFMSGATNLDGITDTNNSTDVFVRDLVAKTTQRASLNAAGGLAHGIAGAPTISGDGRYVSYDSTAADAVSDDSNGVTDAFVYDRVSSTTTRVSTDQLGQELASGGSGPVLSATGTFVTFSSTAPISGLTPSTGRQLYVRLTVPFGAGAALPEVSIGNASVAEGNASTRLMRFTVTLSRPSVAPTSVAYSTVAATATAGTDFKTRSGILTIPPGATTALLSVPVRGDRVNEASEKFKVKLSNPQGAVVYRGTGTGTITNDDAVTGTAIRLSIGSASLVEGDAGTRTLRFTVTLSATSSKPTKVHFATIAGTAGTSDFTAKSGTATIAAGSTSVPVGISVKADTKVEPSESFKVKLSSPVGASIQFGTGTGSILNDD